MLWGSTDRAARSKERQRHTTVSGQKGYTCAAFPPQPFWMYCTQAAMLLGSTERAAQSGGGGGDDGTQLIKGAVHAI